MLGTTRLLVSEDVPMWCSIESGLTDRAAITCSKACVSFIWLETCSKSSFSMRLRPPFKA